MLGTSEPVAASLPSFSQLDDQDFDSVVLHGRFERPKRLSVGTVAA